MKYLLDTNVYFEILRGGRNAERYLGVVQRVMPSVWLSSVVLYEMLCGARGELDRARVRRSVQTLERVGRVVAPEREDWVRAATIQGQLWDTRPELRNKRLQNDILIACSARSIGARLVTTNPSDFQCIARLLPHEFISPEAFAES